MLLVLLATLCLAQTAPEDPPSPPAIDRDIRLLWGGAEGGIGSGDVRFTLHEQSADTDLADLVALRAVHGWLVQGPWALTADDRLLASTLQVLDGGELSCSEPRAGTRITGLTESLLIEGERESLGQQLGLDTTPVSLRTCTAGKVTARLVGPPDRALPSVALEQWETRLALTWSLRDGMLIDSLSRPESEGTRRFAVLRSLRREVDLFIDPGRFLDGPSSVRDADLSLHRPTALALLRDLDPDGLVPGDTELAGGPERLLSEAADLPWIATNWVAENPRLSLTASRRVDLPGGGQLAVLGIVDPSIASGDPRFAAAGVTLIDPIEAVRTHLTVLQAGDDPPALVMVATSAPSPVLERLRHELDGVDIFIGDRTAGVRGLAHLQIDLRPQPDGAPRSGLALPVGGVRQATLHLGEQNTLTGLDMAPVPVPLSVAPDPATLARVTRVRADVYTELEDTLLAPATPLGTISNAELDKATCEAVLDETSADVAMLPDLPDLRPVPGPLTALLVANHLATNDWVEVHRIPGDRYQKLLDQAYGLVPVSCGSPLGTRFPKARGRPIEDQRLYTVVTTDRLRTTTALDSLLSGARSPRLLDLPGTRPWPNDDGTPRSLGSTTVAALRRLRETHGDELLSHLLARSPTDRSTEWVVRVRQLSARTEVFQGIDDEAYAQVPETRATSPSSLTIGTAADVAIEYGSPRAAWDFRARSAFTRLRTADGAQETADDAKLSSSVSLPGLSLTAGPLTVRPFAEGLLDSELTPTTTDAGLTNPRQADLSLTVGLSTPILGPLKALRLGVLVLQDLSVTTKQAEIGARLEAETRVVFGPGLTWTNQLDAFAYGNTPDEDASDLRFKVLMQSRVGLPLARWLDLTVFGDAFVFQGRVEQTQAVRGSFTLGAGIDLGGVFGL